MISKKLASKPDSRGGVQYWPKGLAPFPFQLAAVDFVLARHKSHQAAYYAADPGLGKTVMGILLTNRVGSAKPLKVLYICPPSLTANVQAEIEKWSLIPRTSFRVVADTQLQNVTTECYDLVIVDEAHRFKNEKTIRTASLTNTLFWCDRIVFFSGTPMPNNRPIELWTILRNFANDVFGTEFFPFAKAFCGAHKTPWGWKFDRFTNKAAFRARLFKSFMLRHKKHLVDLPPKREGLLTVGEGLPPLIGKLESKILSEFSKKDLYEGRLTKAAGKKSLHLAEYMKLIGREKLRYFLPILEHLLYETKESILIFAHHKTVIDELAVFLANFRPIVITGATPKAARMGLVNDFQNGKTRVGILNIVAGGIGWNLTRADRVIMLEHSWRDGDNQQAGDRAHRIGRKKPVLVQYVVLKDSFDAKRMSIVLNKRRGAV